MAKTILENTREHDITISAVAEGGEVVSETIPMAKSVKQPDGSFRTENGVGEIDSGLLEAAKEKLVVLHYFSEGWLIERKAGGRRAA